MGAELVGIAIMAVAIAALVAAAMAVEMALAPLDDGEGRE